MNVVGGDLDTFRKFPALAEIFKALAVQAVAFCDEVIPRIALHGQPASLAPGAISLGRYYGHEEDVHIEVDVPGTLDRDYIQPDCVVWPDEVVMREAKACDCSEPGHPGYLYQARLEWRGGKYRITFRQAI